MVPAQVLMNLKAFKSGSSRANDIQLTVFDLHPSLQRGLFGILYIQGSPRPLVI